MPAAGRLCRLAAVLLVLVGAALLTTQVRGSAAEETQVLVPPGTGTLDDRLADMAARVPGFGGMFFDAGSQTWYVYSTDGTARGHAAARSAVTGVLGLTSGSRAEPQARVQVLPGRFDFAQLKTWHDRMTALLEIPGVVMTDIDDARNRLAVGVAASEARQAVRARLLALGVPEDAVDVVQTEPMSFQSSLQDRHRPVVGGLQIFFSAVGVGDFVCTAGLVAVRDGVLGLVTNSHCTDDRGAPGTVEYQPVGPQASNRVGVEIVDPPFFTEGCPFASRCRRSDSAFVRLDPGVAAQLGRIARASSGTPAWGGATIPIMAESGVFVGQRVTKVGRTTGLTEGLVQMTCANFGVAGTDIVMLCQSAAGYPSAGGDSGAAVFRRMRIPFFSDIAFLVGLHWGGNGTIAAYSPIANIEEATELGPLNTCASSPGC